MTLSVLICTLEARRGMFNALMAKLKGQMAPGVEVLSDSDPIITTGAKRQRLLERASGRYVCFIDDDDDISTYYFERIMPALSLSPDAVGFKGWMLTNGRNKTEWYISNALPYENALIKSVPVYLRHTNHLTPVRRDLALQVGFPDKGYREDYEYAKGLRDKRLIKTEVFIDSHLYTYQYKSNK